MGSMKRAPDTFDALIEAWGIAIFAADLGVNYSTANAMKQRNSVAVKYWDAIRKAAPKRGFKVSVEDLLKMRTGVRVPQSEDAA